MKKFIFTFFLIFIIKAISFAQDDYCLDCYYNEDGTPKENNIITMEEWSKNFQMTEAERQEFLKDYYNNPDDYWSDGVRKNTQEEQQRINEENDKWRESNNTNQVSSSEHISSQKQEDDLHYYQNLIGKTREYIETVFPYYTQYKQFLNKFNNYYILDSAKCDDGGIIALLVGFDGKKSNSVVNDVSMFVQGCRDYIGNNDIYAAGDLFSYMLGFGEYLDKLKIINETDDGYVIVFPNSINAFGKIEKEKSFNQWNYYITGTFKPSINK